MEWLDPGSRGERSGFVLVSQVGPMCRTRWRAWRITCCTRGIISPSCFLALRNSARSPRLTFYAISCENFLA